MQRKALIAITAGLVVLAVAATAYAATAINTYGAKLSFTTKKAGTAKKPVTIGYTENLTAAGTNGNRTGLIDDIKTTIYGLKASTKKIPTCSSATIAAKSSDSSCPKGALLATGYITAVVGSPTNFVPSDPTAFNCDPDLDVWNSGGGHLTYFFVDTLTHLCGPLKTGSVGPYPGSMKQVGKNLVVDTPIPSFVNRPLGGALAGSLETEHLVWAKSSKTSKGKTVPVLQSVACKSGKRPWSVAYTATLPTTNVTQSQTISGKSAC